VPFRLVVAKSGGQNAPMVVRIGAQALWRQKLERH
jgi:hypothetical protein